MKFRSIIRTILLIEIIFSIGLFAQGKPYEGPKDPAGDRSAEREGWMSGNRVYLYFQNTTELSNCCGTQYSRWPNNDEGVPMTDGVGLLIGSKVYLENDTIPVTDLSKIKSGVGLDTLYYIQTSYREEMDRDRNGTIEWGLEPVPGYNNPNNEYVAMSHLPDSWPTNGWPANGDELIWPGEWNGRFGRGVKYADQETYFVANDAQDQEYLQSNRRVKYYPRPGVKIGDKNPDVTTQFGAPWGGLGLRVETRGFQWSNPQARDAIFWEYNIANISDYDLTEVAFGYWVDNGIGENEPYDDLGYFDKTLDLAYSWDIDGIGKGGLKTGVMGFAYLESPGLPFDNVDNDDDGLVDEMRDNHAVAKVGPQDGIVDLQKFLDFYHLKVEDLKEHWDADEDQDWEDGKDENGDGIYQEEEYYGDDVGLDGVGPLDLNYTGPDADGTECNHMPDFKEGVGAEPNFASVDISESDMIGLTTFQLFQVPSHNSEKDWFRDDKGLFHRMTSDELMEFSGSVTNLVEFFASSPFPLFQGRTERISMALIHSFDEIPYGVTNPNVPVLFRNKEVVQAIYEKDYRFAQPPKLPTLTATAGDGKVVLSWNDIADTKTREPLLRNTNDFEGYKLFKASDKFFADVEVITDGFGTPIFKKPVYQCDLIDGINGFTDFGLINGVAYYLGSDNGVKHYYVDEDVDNGVTYYYGLVAYDYGIADVGGGITPSENNLVVDLDEAENIRDLGINVQVVTPTPKALGYVSPDIELLESSLTEEKASEVTVKVEDFMNVKENHSYKIKFTSKVVDSSRGDNKRSEYDQLFVTNGYQVFDITDGKETIVYEELPDSANNKSGNLIFGRERGWPAETFYYPNEKDIYSDIFDGIQVKMYKENVEPTYDMVNSGWLIGDSKVRIRPSEVESKYFPWEYNIVFTDNPEEYTSKLTLVRQVFDYDNSSLSSRDILLNQKFNFYVENRSFKDENGEFVKLDLVVYDKNRDGIFEKDMDYVLAGHTVIDGDRIRWGGTVMAIDFLNVASEEQNAKPNDVYRLTFDAPLSERDSIVFKVNPAKDLDADKVDADMNKIRVVPNPYVATNRMEPALSNSQLNQRRRLLFTNIPAESTIRIFTVSGVLIRELKVENAPENGSVHWDMLTKEGLEIAAGMYIYHVKSDRTGDEKIGKFAVIK